MGFTITTRLVADGMEARQVQYATDRYVVGRVGETVTVYLHDSDARFCLKPGSPRRGKH